MQVELLWHTPDPEKQIAVAAGVCYNKDNSDNWQDVIRKLMKRKHYSTLRFASAAFNVSGISLVCAMQMLRHKHLDYLQRSYRFTEASSWSIIPESAKDKDMAEKYMKSGGDAWAMYNRLLGMGAPKQDARYALSCATLTEMAIVGNFQAWRDFLRLRLSKKAQWEIRGVAQEIHRQLKEIAPVVFEEVED